MERAVDGEIDYAAVASLPRMLLDRAASGGDRPFLRAWRDGAWVATSWREYGERARALARALIGLGVRPGDRVAIVAENRPEWLVADAAIMAAGAITVPGYTTNTVEDNRHVLANAGCVGAIASTSALAERVVAAARLAPGCGFVIAIEKPAADGGAGPRVVAWADALADGAARGYDVDAIVAGLKRDDVACIIHTSGTGGVPKGVALSHRAILTNCHGAREILKQLGLGDDVYLSFLPLSHSYEHTVGGAFIPSIGAEIWFAESLERLGANMAEARPTIMTAVPRLYETMHARIAHQIARERGLKARLFAAALALGRKRHLAPDSLTLGERLVDPVVDRLVRDKIRARFGGRLKALVSGGAPLNPEIGLFFTALGLRLLQGYGQTETAPLVSCNPPFRVRLETVGPPCAGVEVRIAGDGEILVRGDNLMSGYWNDEAATAATIRDGWLHTGDVGALDPDGYIRITDRKKDFIKNSGGDMIAPARIEGLLALEPEIAQAMVHGDRRPHLVAVIVPRDEAIAAAAKAAGKPAELAALAGDATLRAAVEKAVERVNRALPLPERVRRFVLADEAFTVANELMTPTLKIRRHKVRAVYGARLDALYG
jgi:long-chain acyl-CoA synthetase